MTVRKQSTGRLINSRTAPCVTGMHVSEAALVERARRGERAAFGLLYDRHVDAIYRYVSFRVRDAADAEDVTSEVFIKAMLAMPRYEPRQPFVAWLYRIARNVVIDGSRRSARRPQSSLDGPSADAAVAEDPAADPLAYATARERREVLRSALSKLNRDQQDVLVLTFIARLTSNEVAAALGKRPSTVRGIQMRALRTLRKYVAPDDLR